MGRGEGAGQHADTEPLRGQLRHHVRIARLEGHAWREPGVRARLFERRADPAASREADQRDVAQRPQRHRAPLGERVVRRYGRGHLLFRDDLAAEPRRPFPGDADDGKVEPPGADGREEQVGAVLREGDLDAGVAAVERREHGREFGQRPGGDRAERDAPADEAGQFVRDQAHRGGVLQRGARVRQDRLPRPGRPHGAPRPVQQLVPQLAFELPDLRADAGLGDVQAGRGLGETRLVDDGDQVFELTEFHNQ